MTDAVIAVAALLTAGTNAAAVINITDRYFAYRQRRRRQDRMLARRPRTIRDRNWLTNRPNLGMYETLVGQLEHEDLDSFQTFMRCGPAVFDEIVARVHNRIVRIPNNYNSRGRAMTPDLMVAITLRFVASGMEYTSLSFPFRTAASTISVVVMEVVQAIVAEYEKDMLSVPDTPEQWKQIADRFQRRWQFRACGCLDGKHIKITRPKNTYSEYYNYKKFYSVVLFAIADSDYKFLYVDVGSPGSESDGGIYKRSGLKDAIENNTLNLPPDEPIEGMADDVPYFFLGDDAFPLNKRMMKPYGHRVLTHNERLFNYRLSRARRVVENAFGILAARFRVLHRPMAQKVENTIDIVYCCCVLHNLFRVRNPLPDIRLVDAEGPDHRLIPGMWHANAELVDTSQASMGVAGRVNAEAKNLRRELTEFYTTDGALPWQDEMVV